jgi:tRNA nucleotidyltransferase/poly(A) polymerase
MPDYMFLLESRLSAEQRAAVLKVQELAIATESNLYLTGGAVRDLISGMPIRDLDFVTEENPSRLAHELEKNGARIVHDDERARSIDLDLAGDVEASLSAARDEVYARPGVKPETRWSTVMEDLRRRDFSLNAIAISLNVASRGLLLDPTNGLADLERREVRALSIHSFTNQPVRLLRVVRYAARMGFKIEQRTGEWMDLAFERGLDKTITPEDAGAELWDVAREDKPTVILKAWEARGLLSAIHAQFARRHPDYEAITRLSRAREELLSAGLRPRLVVPMLRAVLGRLKDRERRALLVRLGFRAKVVEAVTGLEDDANKFAKLLASRKTAAPADAYYVLVGTPEDILAFVLAESNNKKAVGKIKNFLHKWRPLWQMLPGVEIELATLGLPRGPKFDKVIKEFFAQQLEGRARKPEEHERLLRKLAGIKEPPKKKIKEEKENRKKIAANLAKRTPSQKSPAAVAAEAEAAAKVAAAASAAAPPAKAAPIPAAKIVSKKPAAKKKLAKKAKKKTPAKKSGKKTKKPSKKKSGKR